MSRIAKHDLQMGRGMGFQLPVTVGATYDMTGKVARLRLRTEAGAASLAYELDSTDSTITITSQAIDFNILETTAGTQTGLDDWATATTGLRYSYAIDLYATGGEPDYRMQGTLEFVDDVGSFSGTSVDVALTFDDGVTLTVSGGTTSLADASVTTAKLASPTGSDTNVVTGTAGTAGNTAQWNADGDLVDGPTPPSGTILGTTDAQTLTNKTLDSADNIVKTPVNSQSGTTYTLVIADEGKKVTCTNASAITLTVPPNSSVAFTVGIAIVIKQGGAGAVTITPGSGVTLNSRPGLVTNGQHAHATLHKVATDEWDVFGDLTS